MQRVPFVHRTASVVASIGLALPITASAAAPRPTFPMAGAVSTTRRPTFRWQRDAGRDGARLFVCADRACAHPLANVASRTGEATVPRDLPVGDVYWHVCAHAPDACSPSWTLRIGARTAPVATAWGVSNDLDGDGVADAVSRQDDGGIVVAMSRAGRGGVVLRGDDPSFGEAWSIAGDLDGDGASDLIVAAPAAARGDGLVFVYRGTNLGAPWRVIHSPFASARFGAALVGVGDLDGDGFGDIAIGAYAAFDGAGRVLVFRGGANGPGETPDAVLAPDGARENFGYALAAAGDLDGDGRADLAVGADLAGDRRGRVYVYLGANDGPRRTQVLEGPSSRVDFGVALAGVGDVDGDGRGDLVVGAMNANHGRGAAYVFRGGAMGVDIVPVRELASRATAWDFGIGIAPLGDVNGDGLADFAVESTAVDGATARRDVFASGE